MTPEEVNAYRKKYPHGSRFRVRKGVSATNDAGLRVNLVGHIVKVESIYFSGVEQKLYVRDADSQWDFAWDEIEEIQASPIEMKEKITEIEKTWIVSLASQF